MSVISTIAIQVTREYLKSYKEFGGSGLKLVSLEHDLIVRERDP